jgi:hypothetical protein
VNIAFPQRAAKRPFAVTLIALFQFAKAVFLLIAARELGVDPTRQMRSPLTVQALMYIAAHGNARGVLVPIVATYIGVVGWGLWRLKQWARNLLMVTSAVTVAVWIRRLVLVDWALKSPTLKSELARQSVYIVLLMDALVFAYLAFDLHTIEAFAKNE